MAVGWRFSNRLVVTGGFRRISVGRRHYRQVIVDVGFQEVGSAYRNSALSSAADPGLHHQVGRYAGGAGLDGFKNHLT